MRKRDPEPGHVRLPGLVIARAKEVFLLRVHQFPGAAFKGQAWGRVVPGRDPIRIGIVIVGTGDKPIGGL